jgi:DNA-binding XRE family transcriptional regulator
VVGAPCLDGYQEQKNARGTGEGKEETEEVSKEIDMKTKKKTTPGVARPWRDARKDMFSREALADIDAEVDRQLSLCEMREEIGKTQEDVSELLEVTQGTLSRFENRDDALISTLKAFIEALGGQMKILATFADRPAMVVKLRKDEPDKHGHGRTSSQRPRSTGPKPRRAPI